MRISRWIRNVNIERGILHLVIVSFLVWVVLGLYMLSHHRVSREPGQHSGRHEWRAFRSDDPNPVHQKRPPLLYKQLLERNHSHGEANEVKESSLLKKLEQIHKKQLDKAGLNMNVEQFGPVQQKAGVDNKPNPALEKILRIHESKLNKAGFDVRFQQDKLPSVLSDALVPINYDVHVFYYPWYGNPENDGQYFHWNHRFLPHWNKAESLKWPLGIHKPPDDIGANFYPALGAYSSSDPKVVDVHMKEIRSTGAGVVSVSWYPPSDADNEGFPPDRLMPLIMDTANKYNLKVNFHIEPYKNRNPATLLQNLKYITQKYGSHPALYRREHKGRLLPMYYIYDSYLVLAKDWARIFKPDGDMTVRGTDMDGIFIGLVVEKKQREELFSAGFDGYYTYFASNGFTFGSSWKNWQLLQSYAKSKQLLFIPSVGPGYVDTRVRPWNGVSTKSRDHGTYYNSAFEAAVNVQPPLISITSYNEWHEGTQIESAVPKRSNFIYSDYEPGGPDLYLNLTKNWVVHFTKQQNTENDKQ